MRKQVYESFYRPVTGRLYVQLVERDVGPYFQNPAEVLERYEMEIPKRAWQQQAKRFKQQYGSTGPRVERAVFDWVKTVYTQQS